ncbi:DUF1566 domain-containing protein [Thaumasiovibrio subtropicus]|uniref:Lcl domain-containing protein n=1 Tax=Thaumasiovibrio subtropicus TaxID=1891207 RepID=UPI00131E4817|nr:DUF1566 domain-containing protein [Thaumasiovibrio subtropicus]
MKKSLLGLSVAFALSACGGGGGGDTTTPTPDKPTPSVTKTITGFVSGYTQDTVVVLKAGDEILGQFVPTKSESEAHPRYQFDIKETDVPAGVALSVEAYITAKAETDAATRADDSKDGAANEIDGRLLFKTDLGNRETLFSSDTNNDGIVANTENLALDLAATTTTLSALKIHGESYTDTVKRVGRDNFYAIAGLVHYFTDSDEQGKSVIDTTTVDSSDLLAEVKGIAAKISQYGEGVDALTALLADDDKYSVYLVDGHNESIKAKSDRLKNMPYTDSLRSVIDATFPTRTLTFEGKLIKGLKSPEISIQIGAFENNPYLVGTPQDDYFNNAHKPKRPVNLPVTNKGKTGEVVYPDGESFRLTIELTDPANTFESCQPAHLAPYTNSGGINTNSDPRWFSNAKMDNMQDLLTAIVYDPTTGVEMRSLLGSFCELASRSIDRNQDGVITDIELPALRVSIENSAHAILAERSSLAHHGGAQTTKPVQVDAIQELFSRHPKEQLEFMMAVIAMQITGYDDDAGIVPDNADDFFRTAATLLGIVYDEENRMIGQNHMGGNDRKYQMPEMTVLYNFLSQLEDVSVGMLQSGLNLPDLLKRSTESILKISHFDSDVNRSTALLQDIKDRISWLPDVPQNGLDYTCNTVLEKDQLVGIALRGQGKGWMTLGWSDTKSAKYTIYWDTKPFTDVTKAENQASTSQTLHTLNGLKEYQTYHFIIEHDGTASAPFSVRKGDLGILNKADHGNSDCDPLTGVAVNSHANGYGAMSLLKVGGNGLPIDRQDLHYQVMPFDCVTEVKQGRTWAVPHAVVKDGDRERHWYGIDNRYSFGKDTIVADANFNGFCVNEQGETIKSNMAKECNTDRLVERANTANHCGISNWRLPTAMEMMNITVMHTNHFDRNFFPNMDQNQQLWMAWDSERYKKAAFSLDFNTDTRGSAYLRTDPKQVLLVSDGIRVNKQ